MQNGTVHLLAKVGKRRSDNGGVTLSRMNWVCEFLSLVLARPCFTRVILAIIVLKTIHMTCCKQNGDMNTIVIESKYNNHHLSISIYRVAYLHFVYRWLECMFSNCIAITCWVFGLKFAQSVGPSRGRPCRTQEEPSHDVDPVLIHHPIRKTQLLWLVALVLPAIEAFDVALLDARARCSVCALNTSMLAFPPILVPATAIT